MRNTLTRGEFLKTVGAGAAGSALFGTALLSSGCSALGRKSEASGMNVVVVILDSFRKDHVGVYGNDWIQTPSLDALSGESLRFERAYPEAMPTLPVRRAIHTGTRTWPSPAPDYGWQSIPGHQITLAEILRGEGYSTALVTDTWHQFSKNFGRGFDDYLKIRGQEDDPYRDPGSIPMQEIQESYLSPGNGGKTRQYVANTQGRKKEEDWFAPQVFLNAMELLGQASRSQPFFLVADCFDPHEPWDAPEKYSRLYGPDDYEDKEPIFPEYGGHGLTQRQLSRMRALYAGEATMADRWLGNFMQKADELGIMEDTMFIVLSDHGHALGEHGVTGKPPGTLWPEMTDILYFIRHPEGKGAGKTSDYFASTHDVAPTILSTLDIEALPQMEGQDLSVLLEGDEPPDPRYHFTLGMGGWVWARDEQYVMWARSDRAETRLYDARNDPGQENNLADEHPDTVDRMFEEYTLADAGGVALPEPGKGLLPTD